MISYICFINWDGEAERFCFNYSNAPEFETPPLEKGTYEIEDMFLEDNIHNQCTEDFPVACKGRNFTFKVY